MVEKPEVVTQSSQARFVFRAQSQGSGIKEIQCKLDGGVYEKCESPKVFNNLSEGTHTLMARAMNQAGSFSDVVSYQWTVDQTAPTVTITSKPENPSNNTSASFNFTALDSGSEIMKIECLLDGGVFETCQGSKNYTDLLDGGHHFSVKAIDRAGNSSSSVSHFWSVRTIPLAMTLNISTNQPNAPQMGWKITGGNGSLPYAGFSERDMVEEVNTMFPKVGLSDMEVNGQFLFPSNDAGIRVVPAHKPKDWFKHENPFLTHIRIGNFIFGHCGVRSWVSTLGLTLEELIKVNNEGQPILKGPLHPTVIVWMI